MAVRFSLLFCLAWADDEMFDSDSQAMMQMRSQAPAALDLVTLDRAVLGKDSPRRRTHPIYCEKITGKEYDDIIEHAICENTCQNPLLCIGIVQDRLKPPSWPDKSTSPWPPSAAALSKKCATFISRKLDPSGISTFLIDMFWPASGRTDVKEEQAVFKEYIKWTEEYVGQELENAVMKTLSNKLSGYIVNMERIRILNVERRSQQALSVLEFLDDDMMKTAPAFSDTSLGWQSMSLFPQFATYHLAIRNYLGRYQAKETIPDFQNVTKWTTQRYNATAYEFYQLIIDRRLEFIDDVSFEGEQFCTATQSVAGETCQNSNWIATDRYVCETQWQMQITDSAREYITYRNYARGVKPGMEDTCYWKSCGNNVDDARNCRNRHFSAVKDKWSVYWTDQLLDAAKEWPRFEEIPANGFAGIQSSKKSE